MNDINEIRPGIDLNFLSRGELETLHSMLERQGKTHKNSAIAERSKKAAAKVWDALVAAHVDSQAR